MFAATAVDTRRSTWSIETWLVSIFGRVKGTLFKVMNYPFKVFGGWVKMD